MVCWSHPPSLFHNNLMDSLAADLEVLCQPCLNTFVTTINRIDLPFFEQVSNRDPKPLDFCWISPGHGGTSFGQLSSLRIWDYSNKLNSSKVNAMLTCLLNNFCVA